MVLRIIVFFPIKITISNDHYSSNINQTTHQHDHEGIDEFSAFDVNRHYQHRQRTLSDIHPNIAKNENIIEDMFNQLLSERNSSQCFRRNSELQNTLKTNHHQRAIILLS
jgi:hypothetical protein